MPAIQDKLNSNQDTLRVHGVSSHAKNQFLANSLSNNLGEKVRFAASNLNDMHSC